jgi:RNAse (barnase) inhibitor barstar
MAGSSSFPRILWCPCLNTFSDPAVLGETKRVRQRRRVVVMVEHEMIVAIDSSLISDWETFHSIFAATFGFPPFYGNNMNAWIDCMTYIDDADAMMSAVTVEPGKCLTLQLNGANEFARRCPEQFAALLDSVAFVNWRRIEDGKPAVLALSYKRNSHALD